MPYLKRNQICILQGFEEIQAIIFAMILRISNLSEHPLVS